jgi:hypothetical protein
MIAALIARVASPLIYIPIILAALGGLYGWGYLKGFSEAKSRSAILYERALTKAQQEADTRVQEALDAAEEVAPLPATDADLAKLCTRDRACRAGKG